MTERASVVQKTQIGVESTPGTAVAASKQLQGTSIETNPQVTAQDFRPQGSKYNSIVAEQREWVQAPIRGYPSFGDMVYLLSSVMSAATVSQFMDGLTATGCYKWVFDSNNTTEDSPKTFTVEQGSSVRAHKWSYGIVQELGLKFTRSSVDLSGNFLAQRITDGITLTGSPTAVELIPMLATGFDLFIDPTSASLGTTKIGRLFDGDWKLGSRFNPIWPVDSAQTSWAAHVETAPALTFSMIVEADAAGMAYLTTLRAGSTVFARIRNIGPSIYNTGVYAGLAGLNYQLTMDTALKVQNIGNFSDQEGVYAVQFEFLGVNDATWGKALHVEVQNKTSAL